MNEPLSFLFGLNSVLAVRVGASSLPFPVLAADVSSLILLVVSLILIFLGRRLFKALAFVLMGIIVGTLLGSLVGAYFGLAGAIVGAVAGFVVGGLLGVFLLTAGIGLAMGFVAYTTAQILLHSILISLLAGIVFFALGIAFSSKLLSLVSSALGGFLFFSVAVIFGVPAAAALVCAFLLSIVGLWYQTRPRSP